MFFGITIYRWWESHLSKWPLLKDNGRECQRAQNRKVEYLKLAIRVFTATFRRTTCNRPLLEKKAIIETYSSGPKYFWFLLYFQVIALRIIILLQKNAWNVSQNMFANNSKHVSQNSQHFSHFSQNMVRIIFVSQIFVSQTKSQKCFTILSTKNIGT